jgi:hypothetical protein
LQLEIWWIAIYLLATSLFRPPLGNGLFVAIENFFSKLSSLRAQSILLLFLATIAIRLLLLPIFPCPRPYAHDEFCYLLQADMFCHGRLAFPPHPLAPYFETFYVNFHPTYSTMYSPAQAAALAVGQFLGNPWIGVLLSTAAMVAAFLWMLQGWFPARWALLGAILVLVRIAIFSYWMNSYWGGSIAALGGALVLGALPRLKRFQRTNDALLLGLGVIILANSRPLEGFIFCVPVAVYLLIWLFQLRKRHHPIPVRAVLLPIFVCLFANLIFTFYYDWRVTGHPFAVPRSLYYKQNLSVSPFIWGKILPPFHYANPQFDAFFNVWMRGLYNRTWPGLKSIELLRFNEFWLFFLGGFLSVTFLTFPWFVRDRRMRPALWQFLVCALGLIAMTWFEPHYAAPAFCVFLIIVVQAFRHLRAWKWRARPVGISLSRQIVALTLLMIPICIYEHIQKPSGITCWNYAPTWPRARTEAQLTGIPGDHLVIVRYSPGHDPRAEWVYNSADIDHSRIVWAREIPGMDLSPLFSYYRSRKVWAVEPDAEPPLLYPYSSTSAASSR